MFSFEVAPGITLDRWPYSRPEVVRRNSQPAAALRRTLADFRARLDALIDDPDEVQLIITGDLTAAVRERDDAYVGFVGRRGSGTVGGKTMRVNDGLDVLLNGAWLLPTGSRTLPMVNRVAVRTLHKTVTHEAQHVIMHQRGSIIDDVDRTGIDGRATKILYDHGLRIVDEYRAEAAAVSVRREPTEVADFDVMASACALGITAALRAYETDEDLWALEQTVLDSCLPLWVGLAYLAAALRGKDQSIAPPPPATVGSTLWVRYIGELWPKIAQLFVAIPDAGQPFPPELLRTIAHGMVGVVQKLLSQIGFTLEDGDRDDVMMFFIDRRDFPR